MPSESDGLKLHLHSIFIRTSDSRMMKEMVLVQYLCVSKLFQTGRGISNKKYVDLFLL